MAKDVLEISLRNRTQMRIQHPVKYLWLSSFAKGVNRFQSLNVIAKSSILVVWQSFDHASGNGMK